MLQPWRKAVLGAVRQSWRATSEEIDASDWGRKAKRFAKLGAKLGAGVVAVYFAGLLVDRASCQKKDEPKNSSRAISTFHIGAFGRAINEEVTDASGRRHPAHEIDSELVGIHPEGTGSAQGCRDLWLDEDDALLRGFGPKNGAHSVAWMTETIDGKVVTGRYNFDVWAGYEPGTGAFGFGHSNAWAGNLRLIERLPPPPLGPIGWKAIRPGECVRGSLSPDASGVIGRYWIDLPAGRSVAVGASPSDHSPQGICLSAELKIGDEAVNCIGAYYPCEVRISCRYHTPRAGHYKLAIYRTDNLGDVISDVDDRDKYHLGVTWGE